MAARRTAKGRAAARALPVGARRIRMTAPRTLLRRLRALWCRHAGDKEGWGRDPCVWQCGRCGTILEAVAAGIEPTWRERDP